MLPKNEEELRGPNVSLLTYLERYGGQWTQQPLQRSFWLWESRPWNKVFSMRDWSLAYVLALAEDPPSTLFSEKMNTLSAAGRPFSPLVPPGLASTNLAYTKELEVLSTRQRLRVRGSPRASVSGSFIPADAVEYCSRFWGTYLWR